MDIELPKRKNLRLQNYDYSSPNAYFLTICTHDRQPILSDIVGAIHESPLVELTEYGKIVNKFINDIPKRYGVKIKRYIIMPDHIHLLILITANEEFRAIRESPLQGRSVVSKIVGYLKMNSSKEIHQKYGNKLLWQRGFYDHIIRNREEYEKIEKYIYENHLKWQYNRLKQNKTEHSPE